MSGRGFATRRSYDAFLRTLLIAHQSLGFPSAKRRSPDAESEERDRISALKEDLGKGTTINCERTVPNDSYGLGVAYVLNGSCLGAASLLAKGAIHADWPSAYLRLSGAFAKSGRLGAFFRELNASDIELEDAILGANDVFELMFGTCATIAGRPARVANGSSWVDH